MRTLGPRLEHLARQLMARRSEVPERLALREAALRERLPAPRTVRERVEVYVPQISAARPAELGWGSAGWGTPAPLPTIAAQDAGWAVPDVGSQRSRAGTGVVPPAFDRPPAEARASAERLPAALQDRLRPELGREVADVVVHTGEGSSRLARGRGADAVTLGTDVHWAGDPPATDRAGDEELLRHEVWHAVQSTRPGTDWRRSTPTGRAAEERQAGAYGHLSGSGVEPTARFAGDPGARALPVPAAPLLAQPTGSRRSSPATAFPATVAAHPAATPAQQPMHAASAFPATVAAHPAAAPAQQPMHAASAPAVAAPAQHAMPGVRDAERPTLPGQAAPPPRAMSAEAMYDEVLRQLRRDKERGA